MMTAAERARRISEEWHLSDPAISAIVRHLQEHASDQRFLCAQAVQRIGYGYGDAELAGPGVLADQAHDLAMGAPAPGSPHAEGV